MQNYFDSEATSLYATMKPARGGKSLVTLSTYEDRKEALSNTTLMDDVNIYRSNGPKINSLQQKMQQQQSQQQQNDTVDSREMNQDAHNKIPKPPPFQITAQQKPNTSSPQNVKNGNDTYSIPNKPSNTANGHNCNNTQVNRQTLRLGTVTIGEYRHPTLRREPEKFDFISSQKTQKTRDTGNTTPTNEALQSELQSTLTRANFRKSSGNSYTEHQRNCPLHQQQQKQQLQLRHSLGYDNKSGYSVDDLSKKLQKSSINGKETGEILANTNNRTFNVTSGSSGVGILKNGNRNGNSSSTSSTSKSVEKSIKFG